MANQDTSAAASADGSDAPTDGGGGSDKPPSSGHRDYRPEQNGHHVPMPPKEANSYEKQPGFTFQTLEKLLDSHPAQPNPPPPVTTPSLSTASSPTVSDSEWGSPPSTRPPSRAPSMSGTKPAFNMTPSKPAGPDMPIAKSRSTPAAPVIPPTPATPRPKAPSVHSQEGGHKFHLKDLLASGPKLARKSSQRSTGSRDSDAGARSGGGPRSVAGESAVSLSQKYGVCGKVAIGKGATAVVRLAHKWDRSEEKLYAVKEFRKRRKNESEKEYVKKLTAEFCISSTLHHVNVVETVDLIQDESQHWCEVMEFCPGGDLYAAIKKGGMAPAEVECCFKQIINGVAYLHSQGVAHRDIKPENLFFGMSGHLKIGDYGASTVYRLPWEGTIHMSTGLCGSEPYIAPEQFLGKPYDARLVDIWACAIVYYCLHFQEIPWRAAQASDPMFSTYVQQCQQHPMPPNPLSAAQQQQQTYPQTISNLSPRQCRSLLRKMLEPDPKNRATIEDVQQHSWVKSIEICHDVEKPTHVHVHSRSQVTKDGVKGPVVD